ncbi:hypothetical protein AB0T83_10465 [Fluviibacterium sp. DFM31]|uniref:Aldehyde dehydrogenase domain-containing protein n=1 Tax=Meridianimarinicoccus marinus TaxID=3231483 RepID=A0ABV3L6N5_9RHOB
MDAEGTGSSGGADCHHVEAERRRRLRARTDHRDQQALATATAFLPAAVEVCNTQIIGTLGCAILIDEDTKKAHKALLDQAVTDMNYGGIAINTMPPFIFLSPLSDLGRQRRGVRFRLGPGRFRQPSVL